MRQVLLHYLLHSSPQLIFHSSLQAAQSLQLNLTSGSGSKSLSRTELHLAQAVHNIGGTNGY